MYGRANDFHYRGEIMDKRFGSKLVVVLLVMVVALTMVVSGCTSPSTTPSTNASTTPSITPTPSANSTIVAMESGEAGSLDPPTDNAYDTASQEVIQAVYETLFFYNGSDVTTPMPLLATGYTVSPDGLNYTIALRQGVKFHDGTAFNASAVKYSLDRMFLIDNGEAYSNFLGDVKGYTTYHNSNHTQADVNAYLNASGVTVLNDSAVMITLDSADSSFLKKLTFDATSILSPTFDKANGGFNATAELGTTYLQDHESGTGPFTLQSWDHKQQVVLVRNDNYWRVLAKPSKVIIKDVEDYNTRLLALQNGDTDLAQIDTLHAPDVLNDTRLVVDSSQGTLVVQTICFNENTWPYNNVKC